MPCFASWGRRAPWLLLGAPLLMAGTVLMWLPPAFDDLTLLVWYTMCYFLVVNGGTATLQARVNPNPNPHPNPNPNPDPHPHPDP